jgi:hypothetical protein
LGLTQCLRLRQQVRELARLARLAREQRQVVAQQLARVPAQRQGQEQMLQVQHFHLKLQRQHHKFCLPE